MTLPALFLFEDNPFIASLMNGLYSRAALKIMARRWLSISKVGPKNIVRLIFHCPNPASRLYFVQGFLEEEGMVFSKETGNLELIPNLCHLEWCKRFARVLGITDEEIANPEWLAESSWIEKAFSEGRWQAVAAFIMVGFEANIPRTFRIYVSALKEHYGFKDDDLEFFQKHIVADEIHGQAGAKLLDEWAQDDKERSEILLGVKRGALSWWLMHKTMDKEMRKQEMAPQSP